MSEITHCPICRSEDFYHDGTLYNCITCAHEWNGEEEEVATTCVDANGNELQDGDSAVVTQTLKVKGSTMVIKRGTKVKSIRLTENLSEIDCKIEGSSIVLKTCYLKKV